MAPLASYRITVVGLCQVGGGDVVDTRRQPSQPDGLTLESFEVGAQPVPQSFLDRSGLRGLLAEALGKADPRLRLAHADSTLLLVRNFALSRHPLYGVPEWAQRFAPEQLELSAAQLTRLNDDRLGRTLDRLFLLDRRTLMTRFVDRKSVV